MRLLRIFLIAGLDALGDTSRAPHEYVERSFDPQYSICLYLDECPCKTVSA